MAACFVLRAGHKLRYKEGCGTIIYNLHEKHELPGTNHHEKSFISRKLILVCQPPESGYINRKLTSIFCCPAEII